MVTVEVEETIGVGRGVNYTVLLKNRQDTDPVDVTKVCGSHVGGVNVVCTNYRLILNHYGKGGVFGNSPRGNRCPPSSSRFVPEV